MFNMKRKDALKLAKLAETNSVLRDMITPAGLAWLEQIKQPWYVRLWRWLRPARKQRLFGAFVDETKRNQPNYFKDQE